MKVVQKFISNSGEMFDSARTCAEHEATCAANEMLTGAFGDSRVRWMVAKAIAANTENFTDAVQAAHRAYDAAIESVKEALPEEDVL